MSTRVAVLGASGRMGAATCEAVLADPACELVAGIDPTVPLGSPGGIVRMSSIEQLAAGSVDVAVDFTTARAVPGNARWCAARGVHLVCGTTGLDGAALAELAELFSPPEAPNAVLCANFAVSAVLMQRLAELAAPHFDSVEIVEYHHDRKRDAPSGTAIETARRVAAARRSSGAGPFAPDRTEQSLPGARGATLPADGAGFSGTAGAAGEPQVRLHAVRLRGLVAHQEVLFGAAGQSLTIRQDSYDLQSFMPGILLAVRRVASTPGLTRGLEPLLGI